MTKKKKKVFRRPLQQALAGIPCFGSAGVLLASATEGATWLGRSVWVHSSILFLYLALRVPFVRMTASTSSLRLHNWFWTVELDWADIRGFRRPELYGWPHRLGLRVQLKDDTYRYASAYIMANIDGDTFADGVLAELEQLRTRRRPCPGSQSPG